MHTYAHSHACRNIVEKQLKTCNILDWASHIKQYFVSDCFIFIHSYNDYIVLCDISSTIFLRSSSFFSAIFVLTVRVLYCWQKLIAIFICDNHISLHQHISSNVYTNGKAMVWIEWGFIV